MQSFKHAHEKIIAQLAINIETLTFQIAWNLANLRALAFPFVESVCASDDHFLIIVNGHCALQKRVQCQNGGVQALYLVILVLPFSSGYASNQQGHQLLSCDNGRILRWRNHQEKQLTCWQGCASRYQSYEAVCCQKLLLASLLDCWKQSISDNVCKASRLIQPFLVHSMIENTIVYIVEILCVQWFVCKKNLRKFCCSKTEIQTTTQCQTLMLVFSKVIKCDLSPFSTDPFNYKWQDKLITIPCACIWGS